MKTVRKTAPRFASLPRDYAALCRLHLPRPIHDQTEYDNTAEVAARFAGFESKMNTDQRDYFDLLCTLMELWEQENVKARKRTPLEILRHLVEQHGLSGAGLSRVLGGSRQLGPMILRGERSITADHARTLGQHFGLPPGLFVG